MHLHATDHDCARAGPEDRRHQHGLMRARIDRRDRARKPLHRREFALERELGLRLVAARRFAGDREPILRAARDLQELRPHDVGAPAGLDHEPLRLLGQRGIGQRAHERARRRHFARKQQSRRLARQPVAGALLPAIERALQLGWLARLGVDAHDQLAACVAARDRRRVHHVALVAARDHNARSGQRHERIHAGLLQRGVKLRALRPQHDDLLAAHDGAEVARLRDERSEHRSTVAAVGDRRQRRLARMVADRQQRRPHDLIACLARNLDALRRALRAVANGCAAHVVALLGRKRDAHHLAAHLIAERTKPHRERLLGLRVARGGSHAHGYGVGGNFDAHAIFEFAVKQHALPKRRAQRATVAQHLLDQRAQRRVRLVGSCKTELNARATALARELHEVRLQRHRQVLRLQVARVDRNVEVVAILRDSNLRARRLALKQRLVAVAAPQHDLARLLRSEQLAATLLHAAADDRVARERHEHAMVPHLGLA